MYWLDYSAAKLPGAVIKAAGYGGVIRYIDEPGRLGTKHTNKAEYDDHIRSGLDVLLVFEISTGDPDGGWGAGVANANRAKRGADMLGYTKPIFFCEDRPSTPSVANWQSYLDGAASVVGRDRVGAYGFYRAMDTAVGHASMFWQAGARSDVRGHVHIWQDNNTQVTVGGITCDRNLILNAPAPAGRPPASKLANTEDSHMLAKASNDDYISVPCDGKQLMFVASHFGRTVDMLEVYAIPDTGGKIQAMGRLVADADRPGPFTVPPGTRTVSIRYKADHDFTAWCA